MRRLEGSSRPGEAVGTAGRAHLLAFSFAGTTDVCSLLYRDDGGSDAACRSLGLGGLHSHGARNVRVPKAVPKAVQAPQAPLRFAQDVDECSRQILRIPVLHPCFEAIVVETIISEMLRPPSPVLGATESDLTTIYL